METDNIATVPARCPVCDGQLLVTHLQCSACGTDVTGTFVLGNLATLREPHASLLDLFLRKRGNVKELERELGLSYPTVRARLDEAFEAAGYTKEESRQPEPGLWDGDWERTLAERIRRSVDERLASLNRTFVGTPPEAAPADDQETLAAQRAEILARLERKEISAGEAAALLRQVRPRR
jgi:hypothetical protein